MSDIEKQLRHIENGIKIKDAPHFKQSVHWTPSETFPVHRWFRYREGFSPYLLEHFSSAKHRLDPFCGCGTTLLESARQGACSYGIDLNPIATFIARVKTKIYSGTERDEFEKCFKKAVSEYAKYPAAPTPKYPLFSKLFLSESLEILLKLKNFIENVDKPKIRDLLFLAWLSIIEKSSNAFKEGNGLKYRNKRRRPGKYVTIPDNEWIPKYFGDDIKVFIENLWIKKCTGIVEDIEGYRLAKGFTPRIRTGSCLKLKMIDFGKPIDLAIFSPPYANRFDYFEAFKMELWLGGFVKSRADMANLRSKSMRNNFSAKKFKSNSVWEPLEPFLSEMDSSSSSVRMGIKNVLRGYFYDSRVLLKNLRKVVVNNGKVVIVVGNSAYAKSIIPSDALVAKIGEEEGYKVEKINIARKLHVSSQQRNSINHLSKYMRESVVVLQKV